MECPLRFDIIIADHRHMGKNKIIQPQGGIMNFVEIKDTRGLAFAVNPEQITHIHIDKNSGAVIIRFSTDRTITTHQFRNVGEAVKYCTTAFMDTGHVGALNR